MSGAAIAHYLLRTRGALTALIPAAQIKIGFLPEGITKPAIAVQMISARQVNNVGMNSSSYLIVERVQMTCVFPLGSSPLAVMQEVRAALQHQRGAINGIVCDSIIPEMEAAPFDDREAMLTFYPMDYFISYQR